VAQGILSITALIWANADENGLAFRDKPGAARSFSRLSGAIFSGLIGEGRRWQFTQRGLTAGRERDNFREGPQE